MDVLYDSASPPDLTERAGIEAVKQVMGKTWLMKELGKYRTCSLPDYKIWQKNYTETERNLAMMNEVSEN